jgi:2-C-methyl-D-erythritol 4-phosphate cytidylyltransferase
MLSRLPARAAGYAARVPHAAFVVLAGGTGSRLGAVRDGVPVNKAYLPLAGLPLATWSLLWAADVDSVGTLILVTRADDRELALDVAAEVDRRRPGAPPVEVVAGGDSRHASEAAALEHLRPRVLARDVDLVAVHDAARPLAGAALLEAVLAAAERWGGALPAVPARELIGLEGGSPRDLVRVQTPQAFAAGPLLTAFDRAAGEGLEGTDTASTVERYAGVRVHVVPGDERNLKITYPRDLAVAAQLLSEQ